MLADLVEPGARWTLVGGKGGVGKTTIACSLALALAERGEQTLVLSTDPAHSLGDALGLRLGPEPRPVPDSPDLAALEIDADQARSRFLDRHREALSTLLERGTYLTAAEVEEFLSLSLPGLDELAAMLCLAELARDARFTRVVVDTAPTGHTLRLLDAPLLARGWLNALEALDARQQAVARALAPGGRFGSRDFLEARWAELEALSTRLRDPEHTRFLLVTGTEPVVAAETGRYRQALEAAGIPLAGVVVNRVPPASLAEPTREWVREAPGSGADLLPVAFLPLLPEDPCGATALRRLGTLARRTPDELLPAETAASPRPLRLGGAYRPPVDRQFYVVAGKGGVGKTTVASALALSLAGAGEGPVLLLSTDPAGSLSDVWDAAVGSEPVAAPEAENLHLRQLDSAATWKRFRAAYGEEMASLFEGMLDSGLSAGVEHHAAERLVDLVPPGLDELMALLEVVDLLETSAYNALVLDTAPTGHLLRLLEMPDVALEWAHALMRVLLRLREAVGLGEIGERVLRFAREVRRLRERLRDRHRSATLVVALPEALSLPETRRLLARLRSRGMEAQSLIVNRLYEPDESISPSRARAAGSLLDAGAEVLVAAAAWEQGPRGAEALREFGATWRRVEPA